MINTLKTYFNNNIVSLDYEFFISLIFNILLIVAVSLLAEIIVKKIILRIIKKIVEKTPTKWDEMFYERKVFHKIAYLVPGFIILIFSKFFPTNVQENIEKIGNIYLILIGVFIIFAVLDAVVDIYNTYSFSKQRPIKGYIQVIKIIIIIFAGLLIIAAITGKSKSVWALLGGLGGLSAVLILVFKDSLLGLVAGIQLSANEMVKLGDWVEVEQYNADGEVIDITLTTIKICNWDHTITNIPAYSLISDSFKNWDNMQRSGGRRIKRAIYIDINTIKFCDDDMIKRFKQIELISAYIEQKQKEIEEYNKINVNINNNVNDRRLTNIGTLRAYIQAYLDNHPYIHKGFTKMVRQLPVTEKGLPLEIYAFCTDTVWTNYENVQADIFDHILAIINEFDLKVYQNPSGRDLQKIPVFFD